MSASQITASWPRRAAPVLGIVALAMVAALLSPRPGYGEGGTITSPDTAGNVGRWTSLALDASGNPVVAYYDWTHGDLKVVHCNDPNCTGGDESITSPDTDGDVGRWGTSLALDSSGYPVVSYYDYANGDLKLLHCNDSNCAGGDESVTSPDTRGDVGRWSSLALDASGYPVVSYNHYADGDLKVMHCNDPNCAGGDESVTSPDTAGRVGLDTSLALDASGNPVMSYTDADNMDLKVLHCNEPACSGGDESIISPDSVGEYSFHTSLALDPSGYPVVSYLGSGTDDLKLLHCGNANCTGANSITTPDTGLVGYYSSLALDASGNPVISYFDLNHEDLKVLHCDDPACAGDESTNITSPDTGPDVGGYTSLALDPSGNPVVSYNHWGSGDLKLLHCVHPGCIDVKPTPTPTATPTSTATATPSDTPTATLPPIGGAGAFPDATGSRASPGGAGGVVSTALAASAAGAIALGGAAWYAWRRQAGQGAR